MIWVSGSDSIRADWVHPDELNGVLESYGLFASDTSVEELGELVYNSSDLFRFYVMTALTPGTTYFIRLSVSSLESSTLVPCFVR